MQSLRGKGVHQARSNEKREKTQVDEDATSGKAVSRQTLPSSAPDLKRNRVVHMLDNLHRADEIELPRILHEHVSRRMMERQRGEVRVRRCVAHRDADILR